MKIYSNVLYIQSYVGSIFAHNERSLKLFQDAGFEIWANLPEIAVLDGKEYDLKIVGKRLTK